MDSCAQCGATSRDLCVGEPGHGCFLLVATPLLVRLDALRERVTVLERALEEIVELPRGDMWQAYEIAAEALDA